MITTSLSTMKMELIWRLVYWQIVIRQILNKRTLRRTRTTSLTASSRSLYRVLVLRKRVC